MDQKNLILAIAISAAILFGYSFFIERPRIEEAQRQAALQEQAAPAPGQAVPGQTVPTPVPAPSTDGSALPVPGGIPSSQEFAAATREAALKQSQRIRIDSKRLHGSIALTGGRIDDLTLADYRQTTDEGSPEIVVLSPTGSPNPYYAEFGWTVAPGTTVAVPNAKTVWTADSNVLSPTKPVTLTWNNGAGLTFARTYTLDENYMITVTQRVQNQGDANVTLYPYALISRHGTPETTGFFILHEGALGVFNETLTEHDYDDMAENRTVTEKSTGGWIGITDKYWLTALIPDQSQTFTGTFRHIAKNGDKYQTDYLLEPITIAAGGSTEVENRLFSGAKEVNLIETYGEQLGIKRFDLAIDWGWLNFLTRPLFLAIDFSYNWLGNFGLAILFVTVIIKVIFLPLAHKSYVSMSKMKKLQPEMVKLRERFGEDKQKLNQEMMALYKREKANPASGCLPILLQIPVFFALYKVLFITIEMRHAPFYGWIHDLSAPDPTSLFNLFGLIPWSPPELIPAIGVWPLLMGISMYLQQKLNPQPTDPIQAKIFLFMPLFFTFLLASFPAGLVIYWTWNNLLSMAQQWLIMKKMGVKVGG